MLLRLLGCRGGAEEHGVLIEVGRDASAGLTGQTPSLESNGASAEGAVV